MIFFVLETIGLFLQLFWKICIAVTGVHPQIHPTRIKLLEKIRYLIAYLIIFDINEKLLKGLIKFSEQ